MRVYAILLIEFKTRFFYFIFILTQPVQSKTTSI